jgi:6-phosphogluconolactonase
MAKLQTWRGWVFLCALALGACKGEDATKASLNMHMGNPSDGGDEAGALADGSSQNTDAATDAATKDAAQAALDAASADGSTGDDEDGAVAFSDAPLYLYVGSGSWGGAEAGQVSVYLFDVVAENLTLVEREPAGELPSFLVIDPHPQQSTFRMYAADEQLGQLRAFSIETATGKLSPLGSAVDAVGHPVHVVLDATGNGLLSACYTEGTVAVFAVGAGGVASTPSDMETTGALAHEIVLNPAGTLAVVANKGANTLSLFDYNVAQRTLTAKAPATVAQSGGPRHMAFAPSGKRVYVVNEIDDSVVAYNVSGDEQLTFLQSVARLPNGETGDGAEIAVDAAGKHLYVSNRAPSNSIATFSVDAATGELTLLNHVSTHGQVPRHFSLDPSGRWLIAGNQDSHDIAIFRVNAGTGVLTYVRSVDVTVSPFFVGFFQPTTG